MKSEAAASFTAVLCVPLFEAEVSIGTDLVVGRGAHYVFVE